MKSGDHLNIISFDVPFPADYGGVIDVFYKLKSLATQGVKIHLHCFEYGRGMQDELEKYCVEVIYYERKLRVLDFFSIEPFIIKTRKSSRLIDNLLMNDYPILCEGYHSCSILNEPRIKQDRVYVRPANVEKNYYKGLERVEGNLFKKLYFKIESIKLARWEKLLSRAKTIIPISDSDRDYFSRLFNEKVSKTVFAFHEYEEVNVDLGKGDYVLFHGNLSVAENYFVAENIISEIAPRCNIKFVIAGKDPVNQLVRKCNNIPNVDMVMNPSKGEMEKLISGAQVILLITNQDTGVKLKLINSLFRGRFIIANSKMMTGTGVESLVEIITFNDDLVEKINELSNKSFSELELIRRQKLIPLNFFNQNKVESLMQIIK